MTVVISLSHQISEHQKRQTNGRQTKENQEIFILDGGKKEEEENLPNRF